MIEATQIAWLAAMIEAEGSISMGISRERGWLVPNISMVNTDMKIIRECEDIMDFIGIEYSSALRTRKGALGKKPCVQIQVHGFGNRILLLKTILPYMKSVKKDKAQLMLEYLQLREPKKNIGNNGDRSYTEEEIGIANNIRSIK